MPDAKRNAAIYYIEDGFDPQKGLNGRRIAGQSFLKGFFDHAVPVIVVNYGETVTTTFEITG